MGLGYREEELAKSDLADRAVVQDLVARKMGTRGAHPARQKVVDGAELPRYLEEGWTLFAALSPHQVVVNHPSGAVSFAVPRPPATEPRSPTRSR
jgi:hypothetical protein